MLRYPHLSRKCRAGLGNKCERLSTMCDCGYADHKPQDKGTYFITTPIYYVNAAPHLGTA